MNPAPPVTSSCTADQAKRSRQVDRAVVADHEPGRPRALFGPSDFDVLAEQRIDEPGNVGDAAVVHDDGVLDLGGEDLAVRPDGGERPDVAVDDAATGAD